MNDKEKMDIYWGVSEAEMQFNSISLFIAKLNSLAQLHFMDSMCYFTKANILCCNCSNFRENRFQIIF